MVLDTYKIGKISVLKPGSDIRVNQIIQFRKAFQELMTQKEVFVAIDLSVVNFIDSSTVGLLTNFAKKLRTLEGELYLFNYNDDLKELLDFTSLKELVPLCDSKDELMRIAGL